MNKKHLSLLFLISLVFLLLVEAAFAANGNFFQNNAVIRSLGDMLGARVNWPPWNVTPGAVSPTTVPVYVIILTWISLFAVMYVLVNLIEMFRNQRNASIWFSLAFSGIAITSTGFVNSIAGLLDYTQGILVIVGFIVITLILLGVTFMGGRLGLSWASPGRFGTNEEQTRATNEGRTRDAARREAQIEQRIYTAEDQGMNQARNLLQQDITTVGTDSQQIEHLIKICEQLERVRDVGQAANLKAMFRRQAATVTANLSTRTDAQERLREIMINLKALEQKDQQTRTKIEERIKKLITPIGGVAVTSASKTKAENLRKAAVALEALGRRRDESIFGMENTLRPITQSTDIRQLIQHAIDNVYNSNFPSAIKSLQDALNERQSLGRVSAGLSDLITKGEEIEKESKTLMNEILTLMTK